MALLLMMQVLVGYIVNVLQLFCGGLSVLFEAYPFFAERHSTDRTAALRYTALGTGAM